MLSFLFVSTNNDSSCFAYMLIEINMRPIYHWREKGKYPTTLPKTGKIKAKVHVWAAFSNKGISQFAVKLTNK